MKFTMAALKTLLLILTFVGISTACRQTANTRAKTRSFQAGDNPDSQGVPGGRPLKMLTGRYKMMVAGRSGKNYPVHMVFVVQLDTAQKTGKYTSGVASDGGFHAAREGEWLDGDDEIELTREAASSARKAQPVQAATQTSNQNTNQNTELQPGSGNRTAPIAKLVEDEPSSPSPRTQGSTTGTGTQGTGSQPGSQSGAQPCTADCSIAFTGTAPDAKSPLRIELQFTTDGRWKVAQLSYFGVDTLVEEEDVLSFWK